MLGIYLVLGAFAGIMSGLFGIGGGVVIVPALSAVFTHHQDIPAGLAMHMAVGTSLATMVVAASSSVFAHHKHGAVNWQLVFKMILPLGIGAIVGSVIAHFLPAKFLKIFFSIFLIFVSFRIFFKKDDSSDTQKISQIIFYSVSAIIGFLSSILGVGGGTLLVPFLLRCHLDMRKATGTSVACGVVVAFIATLSFMVVGLYSPTHVPLSTGYIYWPAFLGISLAGLLLAPLGAALAHRLPTLILKRVFAIFLIIMAADILI